MSFSSSTAESTQQNATEDAVTSLTDIELNLLLDSPPTAKTAQQTITYLTDAEINLRQEAATFLLDLGYTVNLSDYVIQSALINFQKLFNSNCFTVYDRFSVAIVCLMISRNLSAAKDLPIMFKIPLDWNKISTEMIDQTHLQPLYKIVIDKLVDLPSYGEDEFPHMIIASYFERLETSEKNVSHKIKITSIAFKLATIFSVSSPSINNYSSLVLAILCIRLAAFNCQNRIADIFKTSCELEHIDLPALRRVVMKEVRSLQENHRRKIEEILKCHEFNSTLFKNKKNKIAEYWDLKFKMEANSKGLNMYVLEAETVAELKNIFPNLFGISLNN